MKRSRALSLLFSDAEDGSSTKICTSLSSSGCVGLREKAREAFSQGTDLVEFRLDYLSQLDVSAVAAELSEFLERAILTVRSRAEGGRFGQDERARLAAIKALVELKPAYVDVERLTLEAEPSIVDLVPRKSLIVSWHDLTRTPGKRRLSSLASRAEAYGGIVKIVTQARNPPDNLEILSLYADRQARPIAFCMGELGTFSRAMALGFGTPISYASLAGMPTADGQPSLAQLLAIRRQFVSG